MLLPLNFWSLLVSTLVEEEITWINLHARISFPFIFLGEETCLHRIGNHGHFQKNPPRKFQSHNPTPIFAIFCRSLKSLHLEIKEFFVNCFFDKSDFCFVLSKFWMKMLNCCWESITCFNNVSYLSLH